MNPVIAYDADPAGRAAAIRVGELLRDYRLCPHVAILPAGLDPVEHLAISGELKPYRARPAGEAAPLAAAVAEQIIDQHHQRANAAWPETKIQIINALGRYVRSYPEAERQMIAGIAGSVAVTKADIHPDTLLARASDLLPGSPPGPTLAMSR